MRILETLSEIGQNEVQIIWPVAWLGPGFHPSYSWPQPKYYALFCQWLLWSHAKFLPLCLRSVSWPFPIELRSALLLWLWIYHAFSSLKNRQTFSYPLKLVWEGQIFSFALWSKWLAIRVNLQTLSKNAVKMLLGILAFGHESWSCLVLTQKPGSWKWVLLFEPGVGKQLLWGHGWRSSRKLPLDFRFTAVLGKYMFHPERNVPSTWLASSYLLAYIFIIVSLWRIHISFPHA